MGMMGTSVNWLLFSSPKKTEQVINAKMAYIAINSMLSDKNIDILSLRFFNVVPCDNSY